MNADSDSIIENNISTALIFEDDADWDIRVKSQLHQFALAAQVLSQPLVSDRREYIDPTWPTPRDSSPPQEVNVDIVNMVSPPSWSPYGDNWEVLWLGHCGERFPEVERDSEIPRGRVIISNDYTVPESRHIDKLFGTDELMTKYPDHTRVVHHTAETVCSLAYAVTQAAARRILYSGGIRQWMGPFDIFLRNYCTGNMDGGKVRNCVTVQPQYFQQHQPIGMTCEWSDISDCTTADYNDNPRTLNIRLSARTNLQKLIEGETDFIDSYPDTT